jgi:hypothetical protein
LPGWAATHYKTAALPIVGSHERRAYSRARLGLSNRRNGGWVLASMKQFGPSRGAGRISIEQRPDGVPGPLRSRPSVVSSGLARPCSGSRSTKKLPPGSRRAGLNIESLISAHARAPDVLRGAWQVRHRRLPVDSRGCERSVRWGPEPPLAASCPAASGSVFAVNLPYTTHSPGRFPP